jgi:hypothetical protein
MIKVEVQAKLTLSISTAYTDVSTLADIRTAVRQEATERIRKLVASNPDIDISNSKITVVAVEE